MTARVHGVCIAALVLAVLPVLHGQSQATATLVGRVVDEGDRPIAGARLYLFDGDLRQADAYSDDDGRFVLAGVDPGRHHLTVVKVGFAPVGSVEGTSALQLARGERRSVLVHMVRAAAVSGTVRTPEGDPAAGALVELLPPVMQAERVPMSADYMTTAALDGTFRISGLPAGTYVPVAFHLPEPREFWLEDGGSEMTKLAYVPIYFGDGVTERGARTIVVSPGEEVTGVTFTIRPFALGELKVTVSGLVPDAATLHVDVEETERTLKRFPGRPELKREADGSFAARDVWPGIYVVTLEGFDRGVSVSAKTEIQVHPGGTSYVTLMPRRSR